MKRFGVLAPAHYVAATAVLGMAVALVLLRRQRALATEGGLRPADLISRQTPVG
jgi:hypothetical protein